MVALGEFLGVWFRVDIGPGRIVRSNDFFVSGGTLPLDSASYIERDCDKVLFGALREGKYCYVLNTRQMGKSSLAVRVLDKLEAAGWKTVSLDLTQMGGRNVTAEQWYAGLVAEVGRSLGVRSEILKYYRENSAVGPMRRFFGAIRDVVLEEFPNSIAICIDEIDATRNLPFDTDEFFAGIRECFNHRVRDPAYKRLTFCLLGVAVASDLIQNQSTTPFNVGERIYLADFTVDELRKLELPLGPNARSVVERIHYWTDGHPFLSQSLCAAIGADIHLQTRDRVDQLVKDTFFGPKARDRNINLADVANRALNAGYSDPDPERFRADLLSAYQRVHSGKAVLDDEGNRITSLLKLSGLVRSTGGRLQVRNRIYARVFDQAWIRDNMPGQEIVRQQQSYRRGLVRATLIYAAVLAAIGLLGVSAWKSQLNAMAARVALDKELYVADMNNMRSFEQDGDVARIAEVLDRTQHSPYRGFEWGFWMNRLHDSQEEYTLDYFAPGKRERGILSFESKLICLVDDLTLTASVIDRRTKKLMKVTSIHAGQEVIATHAGFVTVDFNSPSRTVTEILSGANLSRLDPGFDAFPVQEHSDFIALRRQKTGKPDLDCISLDDLTTGKSSFEYVADKDIIISNVAYSSDGRRLAFCENKRGAPQLNVSVWDTHSDKKIDSFIIPSQGSILNLSDDGRYIIYADGLTSVLGREVAPHKVVYRKDLAPGESPATACLTNGDHTIAVLDGIGTASVESFPSGEPIGARFNVWSLSSSAVGAELVICSSSVRIFDIHQTVSASVLARGFRLGRDGQGHILVFEPKPRAILRISDPELKPLFRTTEAPNFRMYTYNGRWELVVDRKNNSAEIRDTLGIEKPTKITPIPVNISSGLSNDTMAVYFPRSGAIVGIAGTTGARKWTYQLPDPETSGFWVAPDGKSIVVFSGGKSVIVLDATTGKPRGILEPHNLRLSNLSFTSDGKGFFTFGADGRVTLWDINSLTERMEFRGNSGQHVSSADLSPDGKRVVTSTEGGTWLIWDATTGIQLTTIHASIGPLRGALFTSDGKQILTVGTDDQVRVWKSLDRDPSIRLAVDPALLKGIKR